MFNNGQKRGSFLTLFIERPKLGHLVLLLGIIMGLLSLKALRYEVMSKIDMGIINVTTTKAGAGPEEVELSITAPLEEELLKVKGVKKIVSRSMENLSLMTLTMDPDKDGSEFMSDVQRAVDRAQSKLPSDLLEKPLVEELSTDNLAIAELHLTGTVSESVLRQQTRHWQQKLRALPNVVSVERVGYRRPEVSVELDRQKLWQLGISLSEIQNAFSLRNVRDSGGSVASLVGEKKVLSVGQFEQPEEAGDVIMRSVSPGNEVRLRDVAKILPTFEKWETQVRTDGKLSIALLITKKNSADELKTLSSIRNVIANSPEVPGIELKLVNDVSRFTKDMLETLYSNALLGLVSVFIILWLFLGRQMAFWVSVGLPFSILLTFCAMLWLGLSVNSLTLMSMILVLGMLVDDAIVTGEAIQVRKEQGLSPVNAAIKGTRDITAPVFVSVLTTMLAFFPIFFLGGLEGKFVAAIPVVVMLTLSASLFESKFMLPAHLAHSTFKPSQRKWLDKSRLFYRAIIERMLRRRKLATLSILFIFVLAGVGSASVVRFQLYPETAVDTINISMELPNGSAFTDTIEKVAELETQVRNTVPDVDLLNIVSQIGHHDTDPYGGSFGRNQAWALTTVYLKPQSQVSQDQRETLANLQSMASELSGFRLLRVEPLKDTPIMGKPIELEIMSDGDEKQFIAEELKKYLRTVPGITDLWDSSKTGKSVIDLEFYNHSLAAYGLSVQQVADAVRVALDGLLISEQQMATERVYYRLRLPQSEREQLDVLQDLYIVNEQGDPIALSTVAQFSLRPGEADVKRFNGRRSLTLYGNIDREITDVIKVNELLDEYISKQNWHVEFPNLSFYQGGEIEQQQTSYADLGIAFAGSLMLIFFVLVVLFNSYSQPLLVLTVIPFSLVGVFATFALQGLPMSFLALIGVLGLIGVLVNDAVVMIFTLNKADCHDKPEQVADMAAKRFRPILITSLTTLVGLLPTAYGLGGYNPFVAPMVMAMAWGVVFGTLISLFLLPCLFMLNNDGRELIKSVRKPKMFGLSVEEVK